MATTTKTRGAKTSAVKTVTRETVAPIAEQEDKIKDIKVKMDLDPKAIITVKNGFNGTLVYKSRRTGELYQWNEFGAEQDMELQELKDVRNSYKQFFSNNWFLFDDPEVVEWLGVSQYYKYALDTAGFDELLAKTPDEIKAAVSKLSDGQKKTIAFRAKQLIQDGEIDSMKTISALEESLGTELILR